MTSSESVASQRGHHSPMLYTFNKYFAELVMSLKKTNPIVKSALAHYKVMDNLSTLRDHFDYFSDAFVRDNPRAISMMLNHEELALDKLVDSADFLESCPVRGVNFLTVKTVALKTTADHKHTVSPLFWSVLGRVLVLFVLAKTYGFHSGKVVTEEGEEDKRVQGIFTALNDIRESATDKNYTNGNAVDISKYMKDMVMTHVLFDNMDSECSPSNSSFVSDLSRAFVRIRQCELETLQSPVSESCCKAQHRADEKRDADSNGSPPDASQFEGFEKLLGGSKIGSLISEMMNEFDPNELNLNLEEGLLDSQNPLDAFANIQNLMRSDSGIGSTMAKLGTKMQQKIGSGEIKVDELLGEVMGLVGNNDAIRNNPLISQLMASMTPSQSDGGGGGGGMGEMANLLSNLTGGMSGANNNSRGHGESSERNLEQMFANLDTSMKKNPALRRAASVASNQHQSSGGSKHNTRDRLRKKYESRQNEAS